MLLDHYVDVVQRIRARNPELILNITTGPGGRFVPSKDDPKVAAEGTTLMMPEKRVEHIAALRPDICTLDLNTMNSGREVVINTPGNVRRMAKVITEVGVKPEIELFDSGDIALMRDLLADGTLQGPVLCSFVMGVRYGFQPAPETVLYARDLLPTTPSSPPSGSARPRSRRSHNPILPAVTCGLGWRTPSTSRVDALRPPMRNWSPRRGALSRTSEARSPQSKKRAASSACRCDRPKARHRSER
jgi:hypothetical protein